MGAVECDSAELGAGDASAVMPVLLPNSPKTEADPANFSKDATGLHDESVEARDTTPVAASVPVPTDSPQLHYSNVDFSADPLKCEHGAAVNKEYDSSRAASGALSDLSLEATQTRRKQGSASPQSKAQKNSSMERTSPSSPPAHSKLRSASEDQKGRNQVFSGGGYYTSCRAAIRMRERSVPAPISHATRPRGTGESPNRGNSYDKSTERCPRKVVDPKRPNSCEKRIHRNQLPTEVASRVQQRTAEMLERRDQRYQRLIIVTQERDAKAMRECTFRPKTNQPKRSEQSINDPGQRAQKLQQFKEPGKHGLK